MRSLPLRWLLLLAIGCSKPLDTDVVDTDVVDTDDTDVSSAGCEAPESILLADGSSSGFERCADGAVNRASAGTFDPTNTGPTCNGDEPYLDCTTDADCTAAPNGRCIHHDRYFIDLESADCSCEYACTGDADCDTGEICAPTELFPGAARPTCVPAECTTNAGCDSGECGLSAFDNGCGMHLALVCRDDGDTCHADDECEQGCAVDTDSFECCVQDCDIGRPLLVDGRARTAPATDREDWAITLHFDLPDAEARRDLAAHWSQIAALEHASVASFARFTLQLLSLGAPPELVMGAQAAAADEIRHARVAYGLAAAFAGRSVGPGPLFLADAAPALNPAGVLAALVDEACIGETLGAAEARYTAEHADPALREHLVAIADDEARHAALAWKSLRWILQNHPELRDMARARLDAPVAVHRDRADSTRPMRDLARWGRPATVSAIHHDTLARVIAPVIAALFATQLAPTVPREQDAAAV